jgi:hypothetical protein
MPEHWIFQGTGIKQGESIPGLIGWEYHGDPAEIPGLAVVGTGKAWVSGQTPQTWTATVYEGPKGNVVFNASSIFGPSGIIVGDGTIAGERNPQQCKTKSSINIS